MRITIGCKKWSNRQQYGLRIYAQDIRRLGSILSLPSSDDKWECFTDFSDRVIAGRHPEAYSRAVTISDGINVIKGTTTFAAHGEGSFQGYITAHRDTWLMEYVVARMNTDLRCEYLVRADGDFILLPEKAKSVYDELDKVDSKGKRKVRKLLKRSKGVVPEQNALEIGLYFEGVEFDWLKSKYPESSHQVIHRYPSINSSIDSLKNNNISCDIDVTTNAGEIVKCVEVKAISMSEETPFNVTLREWDSRVWCGKHHIPYEIVVYYHFRYRVISRTVINVKDRLIRTASGYFCSREK